MGGDDRTPHKMNEVLALMQLAVLWGKVNQPDKKRRIAEICNYDVRR